MSKSLTTLERDSAKATKFRGHKMGSWIRGNGGSYRTCKVCNAYVCVLTNPRANEIDVGGDAVAINCKH